MKKPARKTTATAVAANEKATPEKEMAEEGLADRMSAVGLGNWMAYAFKSGPTVNDNELISLSALIAYVAHMTREHEFRVERQFADRFNIPNVKCLPAERYDDAIRYLVDRVPAEESSVIN
jgi:hypothetical protein